MRRQVQSPLSAARLRSLIYNTTGNLDQAERESARYALAQMKAGQTPEIE